MGMFDPRSLSELLLQMVPEGNIAFWVDDNGGVVVVIRDKALGREMLKQINMWRVMFEEPESE